MAYYYFDFRNTAHIIPIGSGPRILAVDHRDRGMPMARGVADKRRVVVKENFHLRATTKFLRFDGNGPEAGVRTRVPGVRLASTT
jgi:hypothetical protein